MQDWLPGYERIEITGCTGPNIPQVGELSVCLHTMEGPIEVALRLFRANPCYCPHISIAPKSRRKVQHIPLSWPSAALKNAPSGVETNRAREIQVEIEGNAGESQDWPDDELAFIGEVLADIKRAGADFDLDHHPQFVGKESGYIARADAPQRMSFADWYAFDGVAGHQHVPENDHWDPGRLNIDRVVEHAKASLGETSASAVAAPTEEDELMAAKDEIIEGVRAHIEAAVLELRGENGQRYQLQTIAGDINRAEDLIRAQSEQLASALKSLVEGLADQIRDAIGGDSPDLELARRLLDELTDKAGELRTVITPETA